MYQSKERGISLITLSIAIILLINTMNGDPVFCTVVTFGTSIIFIIFFCTFLIIDEKR